VLGVEHQYPEYFRRLPRDEWRHEVRDVTG
jgi:hypothetical protein